MHNCHSGVSLLKSSRSISFLLISLLWFSSSNFALLVEPDKEHQHHNSTATRRSKRCGGTLDSWCRRFHSQKFIPVKPAPRGSRSCPGGCSGHGNCNHDTGWCQCGAGWKGEACEMSNPRPCTNAHGGAGDGAKGHIDKDGRDLDLRAPGYTYSRCAGICDASLGRCFCDGKHKWIPAPFGSPLDAPPIQRGRPLAPHNCQPSDDGKGFKIEWGAVPWEDLYGPEGWCVAEEPKRMCDCVYEGYAGRYCNETALHFCLNQCSGHGECVDGFCLCHAGWYGTDCSRRRAGLPMEASRQVEKSPFLKLSVSTAPAALDGLPASPQNPMPRPSRKRPLIYVYELPPIYNTVLLQYRIDRGLCVWRGFNTDNTTILNGWLYSLEVMLHEWMLKSEYRTFDPDEADFFYVPVYIGCLIFPIHTWADYPWFWERGDTRVADAAGMLMETKKWIASHHPWWNRRGGRDHIWTLLHDEGACYAPQEVYENSIMLTHWGRMDLQHRSNTAYGPDNYTMDFIQRTTQKSYLAMVGKHPCYTPGKDLVIPSWKIPGHVHRSPLVGHAPRERNIQLLFRGDMGAHRQPHYSRGIRQKLLKLSVDGKWRDKYGIHIGTVGNVPGDYSELLAASQFCLVLPGDGWSGRAEDAMLHGCIPVVIMDNVHAVYESILDWASFSLRVPESDLASLPARIANVSEQQRKSMRMIIRQVWHRFLYADHPILQGMLDDMIKGGTNSWREKLTKEAKERNTSVGLLPKAFRYPVKRDGFNTIAQWLYSRIPGTR